MPHCRSTQQVPLVHNIVAVPTRLEDNVGGSILPLVAGRDITPRTTRPVSQVTIHDAPMVFVSPATRRTVTTNRVTPGVRTGTCAGLPRTLICCLGLAAT